MADREAELSCRSLIERYGGYVKAIVVNKIGSVGSREDVEDCISDVFAELYRVPEKIPASEEEIKYLLGTIAKRRAIDHFRRLTFKDSKTASLDDDGMAVLRGEENIEEEAEKKAMQRVLWDSVKALGEPETSIIIYQYFYRKKAADIAGLLSMTTAAVNKRSQRARQKLREMLAAHGYFNM